MKIRPAGAELFRADRRTDRRTDMTMLLVAFRHFAKTSKSESCRFISNADGTAHLHSIIAT